MSRTIMEYQLNKPDDFIQFVANDFLMKEGFQLVNYKGEQVWKRGTGMITAPSYVKFLYGGGKIHIEAWIRSMGEQDLNGAMAAIPKSQLRSRVDRLVQLLHQDVQIPRNADGTLAAPVNVSVHNPTGQSTLALVMGLISLIAWIIPLAGVIVSGVGIAAGRTGRNSTKRGMATAGLVLSIIGLVIALLMWFLNIVAAALM